MTALESLIQQQVAASLVTTISHATDKIAEEMAREILKDPVFRQQMQALIRRAFTDAMADFTSGTSAPPEGGAR